MTATGLKPGPQRGDIVWCSGGLRQENLVEKSAGPALFSCSREDYPGNPGVFPRCTVTRVDANVPAGTKQQGSRLQSGQRIFTPPANLKSTGKK